MLCFSTCKRIDMKKKFCVQIKDKRFLVEEGTVLSTLLDIDQPCGGRGTCGKCKVLVNGEPELACRYRVFSDVTVEAVDSGEISSEIGADESGRLTENVCLALDVGTTTLALALLSRDDGGIIKALTRANPQRRFGADVITRIDYCTKNSVDDLHTVLIDEINDMIKTVGCPEGVDLYVSANVTMMHTFFGVDCSSIGFAPYTPAFLEGRRADGRSLGLPGVGQVCSFPAVSSFVGADIVMGLAYVGAPTDGKYDLLIDLGTNAEIVLFSVASAVATAAAAGPCFEGANISCGMSATPGAVYAFRIKDGVPSYRTVADAPAVGVCGTGLIDLIAELLKNGFIDETGYMEDDYEIAPGVILSAEDVRQYQLAKSAVSSAIVALMRAEGVSFEDVGRMYISGGFSSVINLESAAYSGLLPKELAGKALAMKNTSLLGASKHAAGATDSDPDAIVRRTRYVDLSSDPFFSGLFIENMMFEAPSDEI